MSPAARAIAPRYVRLSGEIADQAILERAARVLSAGAVGHAFASTEAGVGFEVNDGLEGFPASMIGAHGDVRDEGRGRLAAHPLRAHRVALSRRRARALADADGFVDTGDMVELRGDRYYFRRAARAASSMSAD